MISELAERPWTPGPWRWTGMEDFYEGPWLFTDAPPPAPQMVELRDGKGNRKPAATLIEMAPEMAEVLLMIADSSRMHDGFCGEMPDEMREAIESIGDRLHALGVPVDVG